MIASLVQRSREHIDFFYEHFKQEELAKAVELCQKTKGILFLTGIGKSGFIAEKIAMTLVSIGVRALFLNPTNSLHGDLGIIQENDLVMMFSKSGATKELLELIPAIKKKKAKMISVVSSRLSPLEAHSDLVVHLPLKNELDRFDLVPSSSTQIQLIFGDLLTIALMENSDFTLEAYADHHPSGSIGKKLLTRVEELMIPREQVPFCQKDQAIKEVLVELTQKGCGCVLVTDAEGVLKGIFTDGDLRRSLQTLGTDALERSIGDLMNPSPTSCGKNALVFEAKKAMQQEGSKWINVLPITETGKVIGLLRLHDILKAGI